MERRAGAADVEAVEAADDVVVVAEEGDDDESEAIEALPTAAARKARQRLRAADSASVWDIPTRPLVAVALTADAKGDDAAAERARRLWSYWTDATGIDPRWVAKHGVYRCLCVASSPYRPPRHTAVTGQSSFADLRASPAFEALNMESRLCLRAAEHASAGTMDTWERVLVGADAEVAPLLWTRVACRTWTQEQNLAVAGATETPTAHVWTLDADVEVLSAVARWCCGREHFNLLVALMRALSTDDGDFPPLAAEALAGFERDAPGLVNGVALESAGAGSERYRARLRRLVCHWLARLGGRPLPKGKDPLQYMPRGDGGGKSRRPMAPPRSAPATAGAAAADDDDDDDGLVDTVTEILEGWIEGGARVHPLSFFSVSQQLAHIPNRVRLCAWHHLVRTEVGADGQPAYARYCYDRRGGVARASETAWPLDALRSMEDAAAELRDETSEACIARCSVDRVFDELCDDIDAWATHWCAEVLRHDDTRTVSQLWRDADVLAYPETMRMDGDGGGGAAFPVAALGLPILRARVGRDAGRDAGAVLLSDIEIVAVLQKSVQLVPVVRHPEVRVSWHDALGACLRVLARRQTRGKAAGEIAARLQWDVRLSRPSRNDDKTWTLATCAPFTQDTRWLQAWHGRCATFLKRWCVYAKTQPCMALELWFDDAALQHPVVAIFGVAFSAEAQASVDDTAMHMARELSALLSVGVCPLRARLWSDTDATVRDGRQRVRDLDAPVVHFNGTPERTLEDWLLTVGRVYALGQPARRDVVDATPYVGQLAAVRAEVRRALHATPTWSDDDETPFFANPAAMPSAGVPSLALHAPWTTAHAPPLQSNHRGAVAWQELWAALRHARKTATLSDWSMRLWCCRLCGAWATALLPPMSAVDVPRVCGVDVCLALGRPVDAVAEVATAAHFFGDVALQRRCAEVLVRPHAVSPASAASSPSHGDDLVALVRQRLRDPPAEPSDDEALNRAAAWDGKSLLADRWLLDVAHGCADAWPLRPAVRDYATHSHAATRASLRLVFLLAPQRMGVKDSALWHWMRAAFPASAQRWQGTVRDERTGVVRKPAALHGAVFGAAPCISTAHVDHLVARELAHHLRRQTMVDGQAMHAELKLAGEADTPLRSWNTGSKPQQDQWKQRVVALVNATRRRWHGAGAKHVVPSEAPHWQATGRVLLAAVQHYAVRARGLARAAQDRVRARRVWGYQRVHTDATTRDRRRRTGAGGPKGDDDDDDGDEEDDGDADGAGVPMDQLAGVAHAEVPLPPPFAPRNTWRAQPAVLQWVWALTPKASPVDLWWLLVTGHASAATLDAFVCARYQDTAMGARRVWDGAVRDVFEGHRTAALGERPLRSVSVDLDYLDAVLPGGIEAMRMRDLQRLAPVREGTVVRWHRMAQWRPAAGERRGAAAAAAAVGAGTPGALRLSAKSTSLGFVVVEAAAATTANRSLLAPKDHLERNDAVLKSTVPPLLRFAAEAPESAYAMNAAQLAAWLCMDEDLDFVRARERAALRTARELALAQNTEAARKHAAQLEASFRARFAPEGDERSSDDEADVDVPADARSAPLAERLKAAAARLAQRRQARTAAGAVRAFGRAVYDCASTGFDARAVYATLESCALLPAYHEVDVQLRAWMAWPIAEAGRHYLRQWLLVRDSPTPAQRASMAAALADVCTQVQGVTLMDANAPSGTARTLILGDELRGALPTTARLQFAGAPPAMTCSVLAALVSSVQVAARSTRDAAVAGALAADARNTMEAAAEEDEGEDDGAGGKAIAKPRARARAAAAAAAVAVADVPENLADAFEMRMEATRRFVEVSGSHFALLPNDRSVAAAEQLLARWRKVLEPPALATSYFDAEFRLLTAALDALPVTANGASSARGAGLFYARAVPDLRGVLTFATQEVLHHPFMGWTCNANPAVDALLRNTRDTVLECSTLLQTRLPSKTAPRRDAGAGGGGTSDVALEALERDEYLVLNSRCQFVTLHASLAPLQFLQPLGMLTDAAKLRAQTDTHDRLSRAKDALSLVWGHCVGFPVDVGNSIPGGGFLTSGAEILPDNRGVLSVVLDTFAGLTDILDARVPVYRIGAPFVQPPTPEDVRRYRTSADADAPLVSRRPAQFAPFALLRWTHVGGAAALGQHFDAEALFDDFSRMDRQRGARAQVVHALLTNQLREFPSPLRGVCSPSTGWGVIADSDLLPSRFHPCVNGPGNMYESLVPYAGGMAAEWRRLAALYSSSAWSVPPALVEAERPTTTDVDASCYAPLCRQALAITLYHWCNVALAWVFHDPRRMHMLLAATLPCMAVAARRVHIGPDVGDVDVERQVHGDDARRAARSVYFHNPFAVWGVASMNHPAAPRPLAFPVQDGLAYARDSVDEGVDGQTVAGVGTATAMDLELVAAASRGGDGGDGGGGGGGGGAAAMHDSDEDAPLATTVKSAAAAATAARNVLHASDDPQRGLRVPDTLQRLLFMPLRGQAAPDRRGPEKDMFALGWWGRCLSAIAHLLRHPLLGPLLQGLALAPVTGSGQSILRQVLHALGQDPFLRAHVLLHALGHMPEQRPGGTSDRTTLDHAAAMDALGMDTTTTVAPYHPLELDCHAQLLRQAVFPQLFDAAHWPGVPCDVGAVPLVSVAMRQWAACTRDANYRVHVQRARMALVERLCATVDGGEGALVRLLEVTRLSRGVHPNAAADHWTRYDPLRVDGESVRRGTRERPRIAREKALRAPDVDLLQTFDYYGHAVRDPQNEWPLHEEVYALVSLCTALTPSRMDTWPYVFYYAALYGLQLRRICARLDATAAAGSAAQGKRALTVAVASNDYEVVFGNGQRVAWRLLHDDQRKALVQFMRRHGGAGPSDKNYVPRLLAALFLCADPQLPIDECEAALDILDKLDWSRRNPEITARTLPNDAKEHAMDTWLPAKFTAEQFNRVSSALSDGPPLAITRAVGEDDCKRDIIAYAQARRASAAGKAVPPSAAAAAPRVRPAAAAAAVSAPRPVSAVVATAATSAASASATVAPPSSKRGPAMAHAPQPPPPQDRPPKGGKRPGPGGNPRWQRGGASRC